MTQLTFKFTFSQDPVDEEWREIPGYDGRYHVSDQGRVKAMYTRKSIKVGQIIKGHATGGYHYVLLTKDRQQIHHSRHRLVLSTFAPIDGWEDLDVNHENGDKSDNSLKNLSWMTRQQNIRHAMHVIKTMNPFENIRRIGLKLDEDKVREIRKLWNNGKGKSQNSLAKLYDVGPMCINAIVHRKTWKHID